MTRLHEVIWEGQVGDPPVEAFAQLIGLPTTSGIGLMWLAPEADLDEFAMEHLGHFSEEQAIALRDWLNQQYPDRLVLETEP